MIEVILKRFGNPDDVTVFEKGRFEIVRVGSMTIGRATYQPGWRWTTHVGPGIGEALCTVEHVGMVLSGKAIVAFPDGDQWELQAGDVFYVPPDPHDSWVVAEEPYVSLHFAGAGSYAK